MAISSPNVVQSNKKPARDTFIDTIQYSSDLAMKSMNLIQKKRELELMDKQIEQSSLAAALEGVRADYADAVKAHGYSVASEMFHKSLGGLYQGLGMSPSDWEDQYAKLIKYGPDAMSTYLSGTVKALTQGKRTGDMVDIDELNKNFDKEMAAIQTQYSEGEEKPSATAGKPMTSAATPATTTTSSATAPQEEAPPTVDVAKDDPNARSVFQAYSQILKEEASKPLANMQMSTTLMRAKERTLAEISKLNVPTEERARLIKYVNDSYIQWTPRQLRPPLVKGKESTGFPQQLGYTEQEAKGPKGEGSEGMPKVDEDSQFWDYMQSQKDMGVWKGISAEDAKKRGLIDRAKQGNPGTFKRWQKEKGAAPTNPTTPAKPETKEQVLVQQRNTSPTISPAKQEAIDNLYTKYQKLSDDQKATVAKQIVNVAEKSIHDQLYLPSQVAPDGSVVSASEMVIYNLGAGDFEAGRQRLISGLTVAQDQVANQAAQLKLETAKFERENRNMLANPTTAKKFNSFIEQWLPGMLPKDETGNILPLNYTETMGFINSAVNQMIAALQLKSSQSDATATVVVEAYKAVAAEEASMREAFKRTGGGGYDETGLTAFRKKQYNMEDSPYRKNRKIIEAYMQSAGIPIQIIQSDVMQKNFWGSLGIPGIGKEVPTGEKVEAAVIGEGVNPPSTQTTKTTTTTTTKSAIPSQQTTQSQLDELNRAAGFIQ